MNKIVTNLNKEISLLEQYGVFEVEKAYVSIEKEAKDRFSDIYIEVVNKETDELVEEGSESLLKVGIEKLLSNKENYIYAESKNFELIRMEAVVLEIDDLFDTYEAIFGLYAPKKAINEIKEYFKDEKFSIMFNDKDGLWDVNLALDNIEGFSKESSLEEVLQIIYNYIFILQISLHGTNEK